MALEPLPEIADFYDYRGMSLGLPDSPVERPYHQGDIFQNIEIPGVDYSKEKTDDRLAMLFLHPCTMREGPTLIERVSMIAIKQHDVSKGGNPGPNYWKSNDFAKLPLRDLKKDGVLFTANFLEIGTVASTNLRKENRWACLSGLGRGYMSQRIIHHLTRLPLTIAELKENTEILEQDFEGQWDWVDAALAFKGLSSTHAKSVEELIALESEILAAEAEYASIINEAANRDRMRSNDLAIVKSLMREIGHERFSKYGQ